eukprot:s5717_g3.t1
MRILRGPAAVEIVGQSEVTEADVSEEAPYQERNASSASHRRGVDRSPFFAGEVKAEAFLGAGIRAAGFQDIGSRPFVGGLLQLESWRPRSTWRLSLRLRYLRRLFASTPLIWP